MIFVTVGNATQRFDRLLSAIERLCVSGELHGEEVLVQCGHSHMERATFRIRDFFSPDEFARAIQIAEVVIAHGGAGVILSILGAGKTPVIMPRLRKYGEHIDDHQLELVRALAADGRLIPAYEPEELLAAIAAARSAPRLDGPLAVPNIVTLVGRAIEKAVRP